jgi:hypothetical protein
VFDWSLTSLNGVLVVGGTNLGSTAIGVKRVGGLCKEGAGR